MKKQIKKTNIVPPMEVKKRIENTPDLMDALNFIFETNLGETETEDVNENETNPTGGGVPTN